MSYYSSKQSHSNGCERCHPYLHMLKITNRLKEQDCFENTTLTPPQPHHHPSRTKWPPFHRRCFICIFMNNIFLFWFQFTESLFCGCCLDLHGRNFFVYFSKKKFLISNWCQLYTKYNLYPTKFQNPLFAIVQNIRRCISRICSCFWVSNIPSISRKAIFSLFAIEIILIWYLFHLVTPWYCHGLQRLYISDVIFYSENRNK